MLRDFADRGEMLRKGHGGLMLFSLFSLLRGLRGLCGSVVKCLVTSPPTSWAVSSIGTGDAQVYARQHDGYVGGVDALELIAQGDQRG